MQDLRSADQSEHLGIGMQFMFLVLLFLAPIAVVLAVVFLPFALMAQLLEDQNAIGLTTS